MPINFSPTATQENGIQPPLMTSGVRNIEKINGLFCSPAREALGETPLGIDHSILDAVIDIAQDEKDSSRKRKIIRLERRLNQIEIKKLKKWIKTSRTIPQDVQGRLKEVVSDIASLRKVRNKAEAMKLPSQYFKHNPYELVFLFDSGLIFKIAALQNSFAHGKIDHEIRLVEGGHLAIRCMDRGWVSVGELMETHIVTDDHSLEAADGTVWNYFDEGLMDIDVYVDYSNESEEYKKKSIPLRQIGKLSKEEMETLRDFMQQHYPDDPCEAIVQLVTQPELIIDHPFFKGINSQAGNHCFYRIIYRDGTVFSSGLQWASREDKYNDGHAISTYLGTVNSMPANFEPLEHYKHHGCVVTGRPVTQATAEKIVNQLNHARAKGLRYNILGVNCASLGVRVLKETGVDLDIVIPITTFLARHLPSMEDFGVPSSVANRIRFVASKVAQIFSLCCPRVVKGFGRLLLNLIATPIVLGLGGKIGSPIPEEKDFTLPAYDNEEDWDIEAIDRLLDTRMVDVSKLTVAHSSIFIKWQMEQEATFVTPYEGTPKLHFVPPTCPKLIQEGRKIKAKLSHCYRGCTPV